MSRVSFFRKGVKLLVLLLVSVAIAGWYLGFSRDDLVDAAKAVATIYKPDLPISVHYRESLIGKGYVAIIENRSDEPLQLNVDLRSATRKALKKGSVITVGQSKTLEFGWVEGWQFERGDTITISHEDYRTGVYKVEATDTAS